MFMREVGEGVGHCAPGNANPDDGNGNGDNDNDGEMDDELSELDHPPGRPLYKPDDASDSECSDDEEEEEARELPKDGEQGPDQSGMEDMGPEDGEGTDKE